MATVHPHPAGTTVSPQPAAAGPPPNEAELRMADALEAIAATMETMADQLDYLRRINRQLRKLQDHVEQLSDALCASVCHQPGGGSYVRTGETQR